MVAQDCARAYRANSVLTASPGQLVLMLYDGALNSLALARGAFDLPAKDIRRFATINRQLAKARSIIGELQGRLDFQAGPEFAEIMHRLYDYYNRRLLEANMRKEVAPIIEVENLLIQIRDTWAEMLLKRTADVGEPVLSR
jgi:flagellar secretion chaperone FliS